MNIIDKFKKTLQVGTFLMLTLASQQALTQNLSDNKQGHTITLNENNTDSITAIIKRIVDQQLQLEHDLQEIEARMAILNQGAPSMINNEENLTRPFSEEERAQIERNIAMIIEKQQLSEKEKIIKEETLPALKKEEQRLCEELEDQAKLCYLVDEQSQLECYLQEIETRIFTLRQSAQNISDNETKEAMINDVSKLLDEMKIIKEKKLPALAQEQQGLLKTLEDGAAFRYLGSSTEKKD